MASSVNQQLEQLQHRSRELEKDIARLEAEIAEIQAEMHEFVARYETLILPILHHLDAAQAAIRSMEELLFQKNFYDESASVESLWRRPADEPEKAEAADDPSVIPKPTKTREEKSGKLKKLYRLLARRYHPDMAKTDDERQQYTKLMALINIAYSEKDYASLQSLSDETDDKSPSQVTMGDMPLARLQLRRLEQQVTDLQLQANDLRFERDELLHGEMMRLKVEDSFARSTGRDFLQEMADDMNAEYQQEMVRLDVLREKLNR